MKSESVAYLCSTLCNPMNLPCSLPGSFVHGILQARILEWVAIPFSRDLPNPGIEPGSPALQAKSLLSELPEKLHIFIYIYIFFSIIDYYEIFSTVPSSSQPACFILSACSRQHGTRLALSDSI